MKKFFTSESVTEGHPDKICDAISDAVVDAILSRDPYARCAVECCAAYDGLLIMGEVTTTAQVDYERIARGTIKRIGYTFGSFAYDSCKITVAVHGQSPDIAQGVDSSLENRTGEKSAEDELGAGDQGMMFGYACSETEELMPLALTLAHKLARHLTDVRKSGLLSYLRPDGKTQVTVEYDGDSPKRIDAVVVSSQHDESITQEKLRADIIEHVIKATVPADLLDKNTRIFVNPTGRFLIGGPEGDSGLTGRKIIVDTYGGACAHGGGAFSGKDCTKVDRSAAYMARYICKNAVAAGLCDKIELQLAYAIGVSRPVSVFVDTFGTGKLSDGEIADVLVKEFDMRPYAIIKTLSLRQPIYSQTAAYGHFGKPSLPWEQCDRVEDLKKYLK
ncbi:MAG: methionine adenosyltransferase [Clostridia bacterium]|nr:methionine adenosyltransferase [Clostridia bacterium]